MASIRFKTVYLVANVALFIREIYFTRHHIRCSVLKFDTENPCSKDLPKFVLSAPRYPRLA